MTNTDRDGYSKPSHSDNVEQMAWDPHNKYVLPTRIYVDEDINIDVT